MRNRWSYVFSLSPFVPFAALFLFPHNLFETHRFWTKQKNEGLTRLIERILNAIISWAGFALRPSKLTQGKPSIHRIHFKINRPIPSHTYAQCTIHKNVESLSIHCHLCLYSGAQKMETGPTNIWHMDAERVYDVHKHSLVRDACRTPIQWLCTVYTLQLLSGITWVWKRGAFRLFFNIVEICLRHQVE